MRLLAALLLSLLPLAGCIEVSLPPPPPEPNELSGLVLRGDRPVPNVVLTLTDANGSRQATTGIDGAFRFLNVAVGPCRLDMDLPDGTKQGVNTQCPGRLNIRLPATPTATPARPVPVGPATTRTPTAPGAVTLQATVTDGDGAPLADVAWTASRDGDRLGAGLTDRDGLLLLSAQPGPVDLTLSSICIVPVAVHLVLDADVFTVLPLDVDLPAPLAAPAVRATDGPVEGLTLSWNRIEGARGYEVQDANGVRRTGALAWGDHTPSGPYKVRAIDPCGQATAWSPPVNAKGLTPVGHPSLLAVRSVSPAVRETTFPILDLEGKTIGQLPWRVVENTGNCCENYVATTRQGWILDFGGATLFVSKDEGRTWTEHTNHGVQICGEGAVVPSHGGDILGMNWELCLGAGTDGVWSMKYVADDDRWIEGSQLIHTPFFDRPWMSVAGGPFRDSTGRTGPMLATIFTNFHDSLHGTGHGLSLDGVTYLPDASLLSFASREPYVLPDRLAYDPDADWTQPQVETHGRGLDSSLHVMDLGLAACLIVDHAGGRACASYDLPVRAMQRDAAGRLHAIEFRDDARRLTYRWSDDVGRTWEERSFPYIPQMASDSGREWDLKASASLGRTILTMHTATPDGTALDLVYVFRDNQGLPQLDQILQVGQGGGTGGSGVGASARFDFMSSGFLPDGRIALSFRDSEVRQPAVAVSLAR
jgi:hypothetical protein